MRRTGGGAAGRSAVIRVGFVAAVALLLLGQPPAPASGRADASARPVPRTTCDVFPVDNVWHADVSALPVHEDSDRWLATMAASSTNLHPDFGPPSYGIPFHVVDRDTPTVAVRFRYAQESDRRRYPLTRRTPIEGGSDRHAVMINRDTCTLYELFAVRRNDGRPRAGSGAIFRLDSNALRPDGHTSADAAGLPIFAGLVRFDEVKAGFIDHAIRFTAAHTRDAHLWPARHDAGSPNSAYPPMGARFRLKSSFAVERFSPRAQVILQAMKTYGLILADNGSNWFFQGTVDDRWRNGLTDELKQVPASAFEAVDASGCQVDPDSALSSC